MLALFGLSILNLLAIVFAFCPFNVHGAYHQTLLLPPSPSKFARDLGHLTAPRAPPPPSQRRDPVQDLQYWIKTQSVNLDSYGSGNFLLACLEGLLRVDFENLPIDIMRNTRLVNEVLTEDTSMRDLWFDVRAQLDLYRQSILALPDFVSQNFDMSNAGSEKAYESILGLCRRCIQCLEITESQHRDILELLRSEKATEMAELSIQESKRVMLREFELYPSNKTERMLITN